MGEMGRRSSVMVMNRRRRRNELKGRIREMELQRCSYIIGDTLQTAIDYIRPREIAS
jgi:hypothetical protein